jgi:hypothetical protein
LPGCPWRVQIQIISQSNPWFLRPKSDVLRKKLDRKAVTSV